MEDEKITVTIIDGATGEVIVREMTDEEIAELPQHEE